MSSLAEMPLEVLLDNILPSLSVSDLLRLGSTNKTFATICSDDTVWKQKLKRDFNFSGAGTARTSGWKFIYRGLFRPRVYVWGETSNGRLGLSRYPKSGLHESVPFPTQLQIPDARVVSLIAGGMSFHALDSKGNIYVWGTLDGTGLVLPSDGFSEPSKMTDTPLKLRMPAPTHSISCGRLHSSSLDSNHYVWTFLSWGRPFRLSSPLLQDPYSRPVQVECGWGFSSTLTRSGDVFIWWPFSGQMADRIQTKNTEMDEEGDKRALKTPDAVIPCVPWALDVDPIRLPSIPLLPDLTSGVDGQMSTKLVQIAGLDGHLIGLTNKGHVLKFGSLSHESTVSQGRWEYLPNFSEVDRVREHPALAQPSLRDMQITHISANFLHFIAYSTGSSSVVLMGDTDTTPESRPTVLPALQNRSVISVVLGDYHNAALTAEGKLLTWGAYSKGALGLGDPRKMTPGAPGAFQNEQQRQLAQSNGFREPPAVEVPTEVRFDHGRKKPKESFCFSVSAAGWHTGALVIDLEPDGDGEHSEAEPDSDAESGDRRPQRRFLPTDGPSLPPPVLPGIFRLGFPGRSGS